MGEMIKFGIKIGLTIATAVALCAALLILFNLIPSLSTSGNSFYLVREVFRLIGLVFPIRVTVVFGVITTLFAFKVAYWASDKMLWLIDVLG